MKIISSLSHSLTSLCLSSSLSTPSQLLLSGEKWIKEMKSLKKINLSNTRANSLLLANLCLMEKKSRNGIEELNLQDCYLVTDRGLEYLALLKGLKKLNIRGCSTTDNCLPFIEAMKDNGLIHLLVHVYRADSAHKPDESSIIIFGLAKLLK